MDWSSLREALQAACDDPDDDGVAEQAVAAAEIVVSAAGEPPGELPREAREWVETHGVPVACRAMKRVAARSDTWHERLNDLRYRLGDVAAA